MKSVIFNKKEIEKKKILLDNLIRETSIKIKIFDKILNIMIKHNNYILDSVVHKIDSGNNFYNYQKANNHIKRSFNNIINNENISIEDKNIFIIDKESEFSRLAYIDITTKKITYITNDIKWDIEGFDLIIGNCFFISMLLNTISLLVDIFDWLIKPLNINSITNFPAHPKIGLATHFVELKFNGPLYSITVEISFELYVFTSIFVALVDHVFSIEAMLFVNAVYAVLSIAMLGYVKAELLKITDHVLFSPLL
jgi:hypothetical protein